MGILITVCIFVMIKMMHFPPTRPHLTSRASDETPYIGNPPIRGRKTFMRNESMKKNRRCKHSYYVSNQQVKYRIKRDTDYQTVDCTQMRNEQI